jgi:hypothetical protein
LIGDRGDGAMEARTLEMRDGGMLRAGQVGGQFRNQQLNLAQFLLIRFCWRRVRGKPGQVILDRFQTILGHVQAASHFP